MLKESLRMSWQNICANKMRTFLTMLGIIIGVTAIIALITTVESATEEITNQFSALGAGKVSVSVMGTPLKHGLNETEISRLDSIANVKGVDPTLSVTTYAAHSGSKIDQVTLEGRSAAFFSGGDDLIAKGRGLLQLDMGRNIRVFVIDRDLRKAVFPNEDPVGQQIILAGHTFTIVGLMADGSSTDVMSMMMGGGKNGKAIIPYPAAMRMNGSNAINSLTVYLSDTDAADETIQDMEDLLNAVFNYRENTFSILNIDSLLDAMDSITGMMTTVLAGIASIALLVGGIGIMNMMLTTVTERTMEIGLRKALGARPGVIQLQFLIESVMLSLIGGLIGIVAGNLLSLMIAHFIDMPFILNTGAITLAFFFSASVGVVFGWAPARKASRLNPIDALRSM